MKWFSGVALSQIWSTEMQFPLTHRNCPSGHGDLLVVNVSIVLVVLEYFGSSSESLVIIISRLSEKFSKQCEQKGKKKRRETEEMIEEWNAF